MAGSRHIGGEANIVERVQGKPPASQIGNRRHNVMADRSLADQRRLFLDHSPIHQPRTFPEALPAVL